MSQSTEVGPDAFINAAIEAGFRNGVEALDANERLIFLISEAEVHCDKDGIDSFLDRYCPNWMQETARAFAAVGAVEIAAALGAPLPSIRCPTTRCSIVQTSSLRAGQATTTTPSGKWLSSESQRAALEQLP